LAERVPDIGILRKIPIFSSLSDDELQKILAAPENGIVEFGPKETIIKESEIGDCMYIIVEGAVEVLMRGGLGRVITIATLRPGDFFGEQALTVMDETGRRNATVRSLQSAKVFKIDKKYVHLGLCKDDVGPEDLTVVPTSSQQTGEVRDLISGMRLFESLRDPELTSINTWTEVSTVGPGDFVIKEAEKGNCMYVILDGIVEIVTLNDDGKITVLAQHGKGGYFGEQSLMPGSDGIRTAYARSNGTSRLLRIPKAYFRLILSRDADLLDALSNAGEKQKEQRSEIYKK
jgi:CRP-like cAMP-binding protein